MIEDLGLSDDEKEQLETLEQRIGPCRDFLNLCRDFGGREPEGETDEQRSQAVYAETLTIVHRVMGNRTSFGDEDMPMILAGVARRCLELLGEERVDRAGSGSGDCPRPTAHDRSA